MCGRYGRRGDKQKIAEAFHVRAGLEEVDFGETFDAAPGSLQPVVTKKNDERELTIMRWGFKLPDRLLFNVRSEGVTSANFWKDKFASTRCIVPASSYFEWQDCDTKPKPKYEIEVPGREYFGIAGVWAPWKNPKTNQWENTFSTFTSEPNALIEKIHIRQPVILEPRDFEEWLSPADRPACPLAARHVGRRDEDDPPIPAANGRPGWADSDEGPLRLAPYRQHIRAVISNI
jgi:putative SOS response-associated peptidase YedK